MMSDLSQRPSFVGEQWLHPMQGFPYAEAPPADLVQRCVLHPQDEWWRLIGLFERLKQGDFGAVRELWTLITEARLEGAGAAGGLEGVRAPVRRGHPLFLRAPGARIMRAWRGVASHASLR